MQRHDIVLALLNICEERTVTDGQLYKVLGLDNLDFYSICSHQTVSRLQIALDGSDKRPHLLFRYEELLFLAT